MSSPTSILLSGLAKGEQVGEMMEAAGSLIFIALVDSPTGMKLVTSPSQMPALALGLIGMPPNIQVASGLGLDTGLGKFSLKSSA